MFTEAEIRASLVFQLSKLSSLLIKVGGVGGWREGTLYLGWQLVLRPRVKLSRSDSS